MIYFLVPFLNEEDNLTTLHQSVTGILSGEEKTYVFVDDGSTDGSVDLIHRLFEGEKVKVLGDGKNYGPGAAFNTGFEWILSQSQNNEDRIVTLEADNTSDINLLPNMMTISRLGYTLVLASVYMQGGGFDKTSFLRKLLSLGANLFLRFVFDVKVLTLSSFYRIYSVGLLRQVKENHGKVIEETGFISMVEVLVKCIREGATIVEVPMVLHSQKRKGKSKMKVFKTMMDYLKFLTKFSLRKGKK